MSIKVMNWVWENAQAKGHCRLVLLAIADCADDNGMNAFPSQPKLADKTLLTVRTIRRVIRQLETDGYLTVDRSTKRGRATVYTVHMRAGGQPVDGPVDNARRDVEKPGADNLSAPPNDRLERTNPVVWGDTASALPSGTVHDPSSRASGPDGDTGDEGEVGMDPVADAVLTRLGAAWHLSDSDRRRLTPLIVERVIEGWPVKGLASYLAANPGGVVSPFAVLKSRLIELPSPKLGGKIPSPRPEWCHQCDEHTRQIELEDGRLLRCPRCHPLRDAPI